MWLRNLFDFLKFQRSRWPVQQARRTDPRRRPPACRPSVEPLEDRFALAAVLAIGNTTVVEGDAGTHNALVSVTLSGTHGNGITVNYNTASGTAIAGSDYSAVAGKLTFAKNETSKTITVPVMGDRVPEPSETLFVNLQDAKGAKIADSQAIVTIVDDEPQISIDDASGWEGNSGTTPLTFTVRLTFAYDLPVTVNYATADDSASAGDDYAAASGTLTFAPGQTSQTITVAVIGDRLGEPDETFFVNLTTTNSYAAITGSVGVGTIVDEEPQISIFDVYNYGESSFTFTVSLSTAYDQPVTVNFATADGTMIAGVDYVAASGTLTFAPGETTETITVDVLDPTSVDTYFEVYLSGASSNALITYPAAFGYSNYSYYDPGYYYDPWY